MVNSPVFLLQCFPPLFEYFENLISKYLPECSRDEYKIFVVGTDETWSGAAYSIYWRCFAGLAVLGLFWARWCPDHAGARKWKETVSLSWWTETREAFVLRLQQDFTLKVLSFGERVGRRKQGQLAKHRRRVCGSL